MQKNKKRLLSLGHVYLIVSGLLLLLMLVLQQQPKTISIKPAMTPSPVTAPAPVTKPSPYKTLTVDPFVNEKTVTPPFEMPAIVQPIFPARVCNIIDYGAVANKKIKNTQAINNAIADCAKNGGGRVLIPAGTWLTGAIHLDNNIDLHLDAKAILSFSADPNDYLPVVLSRYEGIDVYNYSPLIYANGKQNLAITGNGKLVGNGATWLDLNNLDVTHQLYAMGANNTPIKERVFGSPEKMLRPAFVEFLHSNAILLEDFTIENGPMWTIHPTYSQNIIIRHISILTTGKNNDGIDLDSSKNVLIENSQLDTNDDSIALKSGKAADGLKVNYATKNIIIRNNTMRNGHGGVAIGSEMAGGVFNVFAYNCKIFSNQYGIRLKALENEKVQASNLWFQNIEMDKLSFSTIQMTMHYGSDQASGNTGVPIFQNVYFSNLTSTRARQAINIDALENSPAKNIAIENSNFASGTGVSLKNVTNFSLKRSTVQAKNDPLYAVTNGRQVFLEDLACSTTQKICVAITGATTEDIQLKTTTANTLKGRVQLDQSVDSQQVSY
ncbi:MAG: glycoside hydrolase family 28 protein [Candidatus Moraniibacteriota bacterium]